MGCQGSVQGAAARLLRSCRELPAGGGDVAAAGEADRRRDPGAVEDLLERRDRVPGRSGVAPPVGLYGIRFTLNELGAEQVAPAPAPAPASR